MLEVSENVRLPVGIRSNGQVYREVVIADMVGLDEENLSSPKYKKAPERAITALLQRCVQEIPGLVPRKKDPFAMIDAKPLREMFAIDREYLFMAIRVLTYGPDVDLDWKCPHCKVENTDRVNLTQLEVREWPDEADAGVSFELPRGIKDAEGQVHKTGLLRFPRGYEAEQMSLLGQTNPNQVNSAMLAACIREIGGMRTDRAIMQRMSSLDRDHLNKVIGEDRPGLDTTVTLTCGACGENSEREAMSASGFFSQASS